MNTGNLKSSFKVLTHCSSETYPNVSGEYIASVFWLSHPSWFFVCCLFSDLEDGSDVSFRNVGIFLGYSIFEQEIAFLVITAGEPQIEHLRVNFSYLFGQNHNCNGACLEHFSLA